MKIIKTSTYNKLVTDKTDAELKVSSLEKELSKTIKNLKVSEKDCGEAIEKCMKLEKEYKALQVKMSNVQDELNDANAEIALLKEPKTGCSDCSYSETAVTETMVTCVETKPKKKKKR